MIVSYQKTKTRLSEYIPQPTSQQVKTARTSRTYKQSSLKIIYSNLKVIDSVPHYHHLSSLVLNYCHIKSLSGIQQFTLLESLEAKYNNIQIIAHLSHNRGLKKLNLIGNKVCRDGSIFVKTLENMRLCLSQINGMCASEFVRVYPQIQRGFMTSIQTEQSVSNIQNQMRHQNMISNLSSNYRGYQSIDCIDIQLQNCAQCFNKFSLLSRAFVGLKPVKGESKVMVSCESQKEMGDECCFGSRKGLGKGNLFALNIDMINAEHEN